MRNPSNNISCACCSTRLRGKGKGKGKDEGIDTGKTEYFHAMLGAEPAPAKAGAGGARAQPVVLLEPEFVSPRACPRA